jgi:hypothetical protein
MFTRFFILIVWISFFFVGQPMIGISQEMTKEE